MEDMRRASESSCWRQITGALSVFITRGKGEDAMNKDMSTIGVRFDIDKVGGGFYGAACWDIFWKAIALKDLCGAFFYEGDTN
jgi:hypothetical protein